MDSGSPSRKHPRSDAFASAAASLAPPNKRRRTTVLCNPIPQNLLNGVSSPYAKYNRNAGSQTPAGTSSASGLTSAKQSDTHSITSSTGRSRLAEQIRSFAPKPLMSPFAARAALKSKSFSTSTLRYNTSAAGPSGRDSNGNSSRPSSRAGSVASAMSPPAPRPTSVIGGGLFTPAKPVATPSRRIHHPDFSFDNKPPPPSSFQFTANDSRANTPAVQSSGITSRAHTPVRRVPTRGSPSVSFSSRASPAGHRASPTENKARADSILGFFSSSLDKARQALAGNRADRLEEKRQREKEAIRKQMEEDERNRRAEIFKQELEREEMEMQEKLERIQERKRTREQEEIEKRQENEERAAEARFISSVKHRSQEVQLGFSGANGGPSFVTEDTIPDSIYTDYNAQGSHYGAANIFRDSHAAQDSSQELLPRPGGPLGVTINSSDKMPQSPQLQQSLAPHTEKGKDRDEDSTWDPEVKIPQQPQDNVISLDSDDDDNNDDSEQGAPRKPSFLFSHMPTRKDAPADDGSSQEPDEGEYYENDEYEDEDPSRTYEEGEEEEYEGEEFEEDAEAEEYEEDEEEASTVLRSHAIEDDEIEEVIEEFGSEPAEDSEGLDEAEMNEYDSKAEEDYEEGETEKDDTDTERIVDWKIPKVGKDEDPDRSLDSTVLLPSQPASFTNKRPVSPDNAPSDPEKTPVPEDRSRLPELPQESGAVQSALGNNLFGARQPTEPEAILAKAEASSSAPVSPAPEDNARSEAEEPQTAEVSDSERQPSSPNSIIVIDHSVNGDPEETQEPVDLGVTVDGEDVYNKNKKHIGIIDEQGYIYANTDDQAIGFMDEWGQFFTVGHEGKGARDLSHDELNGMPSPEDELEYETVSGDGEVAEEVPKEVERDLKDDIPETSHDEGRDSEGLGSDEEVIEPSAGKETCSDDEQQKDDEDVLVEEEEQVGLEFENQRERIASSPREIAFSPAKEGVDPFFRFHHDQGPAQTPNSSRFLSNKDISKNLALAADGVLFVKPPASEESVVGDDTIEDEPEIPVDPDLEMQQAPTSTPEDRNPSPMAVDKEPKEQEELSHAAKETQSNGEIKRSEVTEELDELPEASDLVIIEDGEDEESRDDRPALYPMLPDSVYDRSSMVREFAREATVETVEWDGDTDALYESVRIALEEVEGSSESGGESLQSEEPIESDEEVELEDLDEDEDEDEVGVQVEVEGVVEQEVVEEKLEEVVVEAGLDSEGSESGREKQSAEESADEGAAGFVEQTEDAELREDIKSTTSGIDLADQTETGECQAEELEAGVQADIEDATDSEVDIPDNISEEPVALVGLGHQYSDNANSVHEPEEKQQNQTSGIEVVVEIDHARQITPVSENTATSPPQPEAAPNKRPMADTKPNYLHPDSPLSGDSPVQQKSGSVGDNIQNADADEVPASGKRKRIRKHRPKRKRKSGVDPLYVPSPQELEQEGEEETDSEMDQPAKRRKSKAKSANTTPAKPVKLDEQLGPDLKAVETVVATGVASMEEKREGKVKLGDRSIVPMLTSEEASIPLGKELRDGKVIQPHSLIVTPPKRTRRGQSAEPKVFSRENSEEPEVRALRNRNVVVRRGRSVSVEPSADESDVGRVPKRTKRSYSTQPTAPSRDSSEEPEVRALRNRTVIVNRGRSASAEPSASETDTAGGRRKTRAAKAAVPEEPNTPKKRGKKAVELPLSSIKEAVAEDSPKKNARATRKK